LIIEHLSIFHFSLAGRQNAAAWLDLAERFMGSPVSLLRMAWDHEPGRANGPLFPSEGAGEERRTRASGFARFMGSPVSRSHMHWDHEPVVAAGSAHARVVRVARRLEIGDTAG